MFRQVTGGNLTLDRKRSLRRFLIKITSQINEQTEKKITKLTL